MSNLTDQTLALSGVFGAAALVNDIATTGQFNSRAAETLLRSTLIIDSDTLEDIYGQPENMKFGLITTKQVLSKQLQEQNRNVRNYFNGMNKLSRLLANDSPSIEKLQRHLKSTSDHYLDQETALTDEAPLLELERAYVDTLAKQRFRIQVHGLPIHLQSEINAARIRACLLSGVRSAWLWHQLGGSELQFLFSRGKIMAEIDHLLQN